MATTTKDKSLKDKAIKIKNKDYVLVSDRVKYFNEHYLNGCIQTQLVSDWSSDYIVVKASIYPDFVTNPALCFTGYSQTTVGDGMVNKTAALENAETSAVGRALGMMGIGVLESIASADEMHKTTHGTTRVGKLATPKQIEWMRSVASEVAGADHAEDIDKWIESVLTITPEQVPVFKVKDAVDRITAVGKELRAEDAKKLDTVVELTPEEAEQGLINLDSIPY